MKIVKYLIVFVLTALLALLLVFSPSEANPIVFQTVMIFFYILLIYLVWPIGTSYSSVAINRFYIVLGCCAFLLASGVFLNNQCPSFPFSPITGAYKTQGLAAVLLFTCSYLGKVPTSLLLSALGARLIYLGYTNNLTHHSSEIG